jgi:hypothetical protein
MDKPCDGHASSANRIATLEAALEAVLLFHDANVWDLPKRAAWQTLTGQPEATTKVLCDTVRRALQAATQPDKTTTV